MVSVLVIYLHKSIDLRKVWIPICLFKIGVDFLSKYSIDVVETKSNQAL